MRNLKEIIKEGYENLNSDFLSFIKDIKNITTKSNGNL